MFRRGSNIRGGGLKAAGYGVHFRPRIQHTNGLKQGCPGQKGENAGAKQNASRTREARVFAAELRRRSGRRRRTCDPPPVRQAFSRPRYALLDFAKGKTERQRPPHAKNFACADAQARDGTQCAGCACCDAITYSCSFYYSVSAPKSPD